KAMTGEIQKIGVNINQIARRVNATGSVYHEDIEEIQGVLAELWLLQRLSLLKAR
uniref:plasmid mobilization relaxosome protein MobC n=1 Tax=Clostridioides difficile TaxID=1496 RepID=UPI001C673E0B